MTSTPDRLNSRFRGCLLAGAVGDALGAPIEFLSMDEILAQFGPKGVDSLEPAYGRIGAITDDTQMTLFTAEGLLRARSRFLGRGICHTPSVVSAAYQRWLFTQGETNPSIEVDCDGWLIQHPALFARRAPGTTCLTALRNTSSRGEAADNNSKGCGGVMRVAPVALMAVSEGRHNSLTDTLRWSFDTAAEICALTHGHPTGSAAGGALAAIISALLLGESLPAAIGHADDLLGDMPEHRETLIALRAACEAASDNPGNMEVLSSLGEGWLAEEALAIAIYCALSCSSVRDALLLAVNHGGDSDSTGSIAGNIVGAIHGVGLIPADWLAALELREVIDEMAMDLLECGSRSSYEFAGSADPHFRKYPGY